MLTWSAMGYSGHEDHADGGPSTATGKRTAGATPGKPRARRWTPPAGAPRRVLTLPETAAYLGVSPWTVRELQWSGMLPRVNLGRKLLFDRADLDALIERQKERPLDARQP
jgi:excisionase family DNA binding protein